MRLVLDTNILVAALIKDSITRRILLLSDLEFLLPAFALDELARHRAKIARAARLKVDEIDLLPTLLLTSVVVVPFVRIAPYLPAAHALMGAIDPDDVPFVGLARIIHEHFCCNRRSAVSTSLRSAGSPLKSSTYCTSTPRVLPAPRAGLTTRLGDFATNRHE